MSNNKESSKVTFGSVNHVSVNGKASNGKSSGGIFSSEDMGKTRTIDNADLLKHELKSHYSGGENKDIIRMSAGYKNSGKHTVFTASANPRGEDRPKRTDNNTRFKLLDDIGYKKVDQAGERVGDTRIKTVSPGAARPDLEDGARSNQPKLPAHKKLGCLNGLLYFVFVISVSALLAAVGWICASDVLALNKEPLTASVTVPKDFTINQVADELKKAGIIEYKWLFKIFADFADAEEKIDPGTYELNTSLDYRAIVSKMHFGAEAKPDETVTVTIIEGKTLAEIFEILEQNMVCKAEDLWEAAANYDFKYDFLDSSTLGNDRRLEGYLFPDTYQFFLDDKAENVIEKFLDNFDYRVTDEMRAEAESLGYSLADIVKVASLIEKETADASESPYIASVIYNRLRSSAFPYLQIDATIQYILPERKGNLTNEDLEIDSPYNTYKYEGLPPTAISNPGLASIKAALSPADTDFYFYALSKDGLHKFFTNSDDFDDFVNGEDYGG